MADNAVSTVTPKVGVPNPPTAVAAEFAQLAVAARDAALGDRSGQATAQLRQAARERPERMRQAQQRDT